MSNGILYIVATPIGNLEDITLRVLRLLREEIGAVFCEDTRRSGRLLQHYDIRLPLHSLHAHSSHQSTRKALEYLENGVSIAYMTDCGTPAVSDPGSALVAAAAAAGYTVLPLPGASAMTAALSVSGFGGRHVLFAGFPGKKAGRMTREFQELARFDGIIIFYESPHRIRKTLDILLTVFPGQDVVVCRELTKMHEECVRFSLTSPLPSITEKGEIAVVINNSAKSRPDDDSSDSDI